MGKGGKAESLTTTQNQYKWDEIAKHSTRDDRWLVIDNEVYDITNWSKKHPGGSKVISHYAGQDGTSAFKAFHNDQEFAKKYMKAIHVGSVEESSVKTNNADKDFEELREIARRMGLFDASVPFFLLSVFQLIFFEFMSIFVLYYVGTGWVPFTISILFMATEMVQAGWVQHDYGHLSGFKSRKWNHILHHSIIGIMQGASASWWNHMHYQHHAKPNVINKDPDVRLDMLFVVGETIPVKVAKAWKKSMPYNFQHKYFFLLGPPLLFPLYFQYTTFYHMFTRKLWGELFIATAGLVRIFGLTTPLLGFGWAFFHFEAMRMIQSIWFTYVSQSNHIPMHIEEDVADKSWLALQLHATCNVEKSFFNDWFTGHLNFQIEHHLFPTMPRHNLHKVTPLVRSLCEKHGVPYILKSMPEAFSDIFRSLKKSGKLWKYTYDAHHHT